MLKRLRLIRFKNFEDATLSLGPFTLLVGANASGKSNVREALRFLHGVGRGYTLAEVFGGKWLAGERQWEGLRGGVREVSFRGAASFALEVDVEVFATSTLLYAGRYSIEVETSPSPPQIIKESLQSSGKNAGLVYEAHGSIDPSGQGRTVVTTPAGRPRMIGMNAPSSDRPVLFQFDPTESSSRSSDVSDVGIALSSMRFIDLSPEAMRQPSVPGQQVLADRGENLSSVLQSICARAAAKAELIHWIRALTPMDVVDLKFDVDRLGQVLLLLVEHDGTELSAYSASEGTLRFLGLLAALLSPQPGLFFFEEIENGLHPSRLRLLLDLIRTRTGEHGLKVVATTHSPALLAQLDEGLLEHASLVYRLEETPSAHIVRLLDVPDAQRILRIHDRGDLLASGWFEDMMEFGASPREPLKRASDAEGSP
jgi:AAA domain, putative AbiEii toxin, Type IV TA system